MARTIDRLDPADREGFLADQIELMNRPLQAVILISALLFFASGLWDLLRQGLTEGRIALWRADYGLLLLVLAYAFSRARHVPLRLALGLGYLCVFCTGLALAVIAAPERLPYLLAAFALVPVVAGALWTRARFMAVAMAACLLPPLAMLVIVDAGATDWSMYALFLAIGAGIGEVMRRLRLQVAVDIYLLRRRLQLQASSDALTGVLNRGGWDRHAERVLQHARSLGRPAAVAFFDLDHFKRINDSHGHAIGDRVLERAAGAIRAGLREGDLVTRYGGEEFVALLPGADREAASGVAERIRAALAAGSDPVPVTISVGVSGCRDAEPLADCLRRADMALLEAKARGRNRVVAWTDEGPTEDSSGNGRVVPFPARKN